MAEYVLWFLTGMLRGGIFAITPGKDTFVGRSEDADMPILDSAVSRRHARLWVEDGALHVEDLHSRNGTLVNGRAIDRSPLRIGDYLTIGSSIIQVADPAWSKHGGNWALTTSTATLPKVHKRPPDRLSGSLAELPLSDLLQMLERSPRDRLLVLNKDGECGRIFFRHGRPCYAAIDRRIEGRPHKALYRMLSWHAGTFNLEPATPSHFPVELTESPAELLFEGFRQFDEGKLLADALSPLDRHVIPNDDAPPDLADPERTTLEIAAVRPTIAHLIDASPFTDLEAMQSLARLLAHGLLVMTD